MCVFFFFKQKTAYERRISDWSSDVCSSDLVHFLKRMDDEVRRRLDHLLEEIGVADPALRILPIGRAVCEFILIDDDEDVIVRTILVGILRCLDPIAAGVRAEKDDLENPAVTPCANGILRRGA